MDMGLCERLIPLIPNGKNNCCRIWVSDVEVIKTYTLYWGRCFFNRSIFHERVPSIEEELKNLKCFELKKD